MFSVRIALPNSLTRGLFLLFSALAFVSLSACQTASQQTASLQSDALTRSAEMHAQLAFGYYGLNKYEIALEEAQIAVAISPTHASAYNALGLIRMALKENTEADVAFRSAVSLSPTDPDIQHNYAVFLCSMNKATEAKKYFDAAIALPLYQNPERSLFAAGLCLRNAGQNKLALPYFLQILPRSSENIAILSSIVEIEVALGNYEQATPYLNRWGAVLKAPNADFLRLKIKVEKGLGHLESAEEAQQELRRYFPE